MMSSGGASGSGPGAGAGFGPAWRRQRGPGVTDGRSDDEKKARASLQERMAIKAQALMLVGVAAATAYFTDFVHVVLDDPRVYRGYFRLACTCLGANAAIGFYLMVWLPRTRAKESRAGAAAAGDVDWSVTHPQLLPAATAAGVVGAFCLVRSLWPVWGFLAPLILLTELTGAIFALHFIPWPF